MSKLLPKIGLRSATILVVSVIVGSGVFKKIAPMSAELGSPILVILCWIFAFQIRNIKCAYFKKLVEGYQQDSFWIQF